jgi:hypothetical protein
MESFLKQYGYYPEQVFLQFDGGSDNANKYVLGMLELLVVKRMARKVLFTRLPVGHTHEDIDSIFGVIARTIRGKPFDTLQQMKDLLEQALGGPYLKLIVKPTYVIPNYKKFLKSHVDSELKRLHKQDQTQHQWIFEYTDQCANFPLGCKTTYRAYSSDLVVELVKTCKEQCLTPVGQATGLEAVSTFVVTYPSAEPPGSLPGILYEFIYLILLDFNIASSAFVFALSKVEKEWKDFFYCNRSLTNLS